MKKTSFTISILISFSLSLLGQINYQGCTNLITTGPSSYTLTQSSTTDDGGTIRNTYASTPASCSAGACSYTMIWSIANQRWELRFNGSNLFHYNSEPSAPNPPDLNLGTWVNETGCNDITTLSGDVQSSTSLPVELISFTSEIKRSELVLFWETASEFNNKKFEVEQSNDGQEFHKIGEIEGAGTTLEAQNYSFSVKNLRTGAHYFRLKQVDFDGQFEYSEIINVELKANISRLLEIGDFYPNPTQTGQVHLSCFTENTTSLHITIFDMAGQSLFYKKQSVTGEHDLLFDFSFLEKGLYLVQLNTAEAIFYKKLIVK